MTFAITLTSFQMERQCEKGEVRGHFPLTLFCTFKSRKVLRKEEKRGDLSFCLLAIDSDSVKKHNRVKSVLKSGGGPQQQCAFFTDTNLKESHCPPCVPNTHSGVCPLFLVQNEAGKGMWLWSWRHKMYYRNTMKECPCLPQAAALSIFYNHHNVQQRYLTIIKYLIVDEAKHRQWHCFSTACII